MRTEGGGAGEETAAFAAFAETPETPENFDSVGVFDAAPRATPLFTSQTRKGANSNSPPEVSSPTPGEPPDAATASNLDASRDDSIEEAVVVVVVAILDRFRAVPPPSPPRRSSSAAAGDDA